MLSLNRHLLLAASHSLNVYSISTSLLLRKFQISDNSFVVDFKLSIRDPNLAIIALSDGSVHLWNWTTGERGSSFELNCQITALDITDNKDSSSDILILIARTKDTSKGSIIGMVNLSQESSNGDPLVKLHETNEILQSVQVFYHGRVMFAASQTTMIVATSGKRQNEDLTRLTWKTFGFPEGLSCFSARYFENKRQTESSSSKKVNHYSLAIGSKTGAIYLYEDILVRLRRDSPLNVRRLHWHRNRVGTLKWSRDGRLPL